ncbi:glutamate--tRNA ligase [Plasmodium gonderi]|uniref:glutamate--tRNA ligase n=1 Tax=Plasmodium gonderi TaxID=77519 RepID=A0A1Y1JNP5_PLAGO|nr:glutamate--tRNA ligase [Plasmodium gonderi]GAW81684.1 glutamate--tRNA ligase [Plasmodium gonderi]
MKLTFSLLNLVIINANVIVESKGSIQSFLIKKINHQIVLLYHKRNKLCFILKNKKGKFCKYKGKKCKAKKNKILKGEDVNNPCVHPRLRFAPSPTGFLHIGGCRTFLYNYILAKQLNGSLILRMEDTDASRNTQSSFYEIIKDLRWLNLSWDEGPDIGGAYGPYKQSEKIELYKKIAHDLIEEGKAYFCFCSKEELNEKKEMAKRTRTKYAYDRTCRNLINQKVQEFILEKKSYTIRFKSPIGRKIILKDILKNEIVDTVNEDFIILRSDYSPTYNFAASVDDYLMKISHVIRGVEHISNTFKQILVLEALNAQIPMYAHVPVLTTVEKKKISKRNNECLIRNLRDEGFNPDCIINYIGTLGWGSASRREFYTLDELIGTFDLHALNKSALVFDIKKLKWMNKKYMLNQDLETYVKRAQEFLIGKQVLIKGGMEFIKLCISSFKDDVHNYEELKEYIIGVISYDHLNHQLDKNNELLKKITVFLCNLWDENKNSKKCFETFMAENFDELIQGLMKDINIRKNEILLKVRYLLTFQNKGVPFVHLFKLWALATKNKVPNYVPLKDRIQYLRGVFGV